MARLSARLQQRAGALLGLAVALALIAVTAAVVLPRNPGGTSTTVAAERRAAAQAEAAQRAREITGQRADRAQRSPVDTPGTASRTGAATTAAGTGTGHSSASAAVSSGSGSSSTGSSMSSAATATPGGIAWGTSVMRYGNETYAEAFARDREQLAPEIVRYYIPGTGGPRWPTTTGSMPLDISFKLLPAEVLNGSRDAQLTAFFAATPRLTYWTYWHEPENDMQRGAFTAAQYRAAWAHIAAIARASGKPLRATLVLMGFTAKPGSGRTWTDYYAGPNVIDVLAWDAYAWSAKDTPASVYGSLIQASLQAGKPWAIGETGVPSVQVPDPTKRKAMLTAMSRYLADAPNPPVFVTYFDSDSDLKPRIIYGWNISKDPSAAAAWRAGQSG